MVDNIRYSENVLLIHSINELTVEQAIEYKKDNAKVVVIDAPAYGINEGLLQRNPYTIDEYIAVRSKLDELVEGIDNTKPEKEKFAEIYKRVCSNITYDYAAAYPKTNAEREYSDENLYNSRNLLNGLLDGQCVCAGYADILRSALNLSGIESCYIEGVIETLRSKTKNRIIKGYYMLPEKSIFKKVIERAIEKFEEEPCHAWVKVKLDGNWYNADPTFDADRIRCGLEPLTILKTDQELENEYHRPYIQGPECITKFPRKEVNRLFGHNNKFIGDFKIPNMNDFIMGCKAIGNEFADLGERLKSRFIGFIEKIKGLMSTKKALTPGEQNNNNLDLIDENLDDIADDIKEEKEQNEKIQSWDLENWNMKPDDLFKDEQQEETIKKTEEKEDKEK